MTDVTPLALAGRLLGAAADRVERIEGSGNNRLYRVSAAGRRYALKYYPADDRDRLGAEFHGLGFLCAHGIEAVARPLAADPVQRAALYQWLDGVRPPALGPADLAAVFEFLGRLAGLSRLDAADRLPAASDACLRHGDVCRQLDRRLARLTPCLDENPSLAAFVSQALLPACRRLTAGHDRLLAAAGLVSGQALARDRQFLSPADFGRHNMLRTADGRLFFLDFEYFGRDDPAKFLCDFALHPGSDFPDAVRADILQRGMALFAPADPDFGLRVRAMIGICGLLWCLIILNVFLPDLWRRRVDAGERGTYESVGARQLALAERHLARLAEVIDVCQSF